MPCPVMPRAGTGGVGTGRACETGGSGRIAGLLLVVAAVLWPAAVAAAGEGTVPEPEGYRLENFRAPVPATLAGATVVTTDELRRMLERGDEVVLIDVLPAPRRPEGLRPGTLWRPKTRRNIPGSVWLPNTGYGILPVEEEEYLRRNLARLSAGSARRPLVFYCLADCWMSWNAAKRALSWGYSEVYWYPDGTDGWVAASLPLEESTPFRSEGD